MMSFNCNDIIASILFTFIFIIIFGFSKLINIIFPGWIELSRKTAHFLSGILSLFLPFYIKDIKIIAIMCFIMLLFLIIMKILNRMDEIHKIERKSIGVYLFPIAVFLIYALSFDKIYLYFISILVLTISDTLAALIGKKYGSIPIEVEGNIKSVEGSITFCIITFICIEISLLLMTDLDKLHIIFISFIVAIVVTGFEIISLWGTDNLFIPLGTFYIINRISQYQINISIITIFQLFLSIIIVFIIYRKINCIKNSWKIAIALFIFGSFALCESWWTFSTIIFCVLIMVILRFFIRDKNNIDVKSALRIGITPTLFIFISATLNDYFLLYPIYLIVLSSESILLIHEFVINNDDLKKENVKNKVLKGSIFIFLLLSITIIPAILFYNQLKIFDLSFIILSGIIINIILYILIFILFNKIKCINKNLFDIYSNSRFASILIGSLITSFIILVGKL